MFCLFRFALISSLICKVEGGGGGAFLFTSSFARKEGMGIMSLVAFHC